MSVDHFASPPEEARSEYAAKRPSDDSGGSPNRTQRAADSGSKPVGAHCGKLFAAPDFALFVVPGVHGDAV
jgi:hypothetical protein